MTNELTTFEDKRPVIMKTGIVHWVNPETADNISNILANQQAHSFIRISELQGVTINTAEVSEVSTQEQYNELVHVRLGESKCLYGTWHAKRQKCECKEDRAKTHRQNMEEIERRKLYAPMTDEERASAQAHLKKLGDEMRAKGILKSSGLPSGYVLNRSKLIEYEKKFGMPYSVPHGATIVEDVPDYTKA